MSRYSGKCDLFDFMSGSGGWFDASGNVVSIDDPNVHVLYSDEMKDFIAFKKRTHGVLHQHKKVKVTEWNQEEIAKNCKYFEVIKHTKIVEDKRCKNSQREVVTYTYKYFDKEYTLKELNKHGVYITIDIHFDTLLDLIPYYPYIVSASSGENVYISNESYVLEERDEHLEYGHFSDWWEYYTKLLQNHYREIVLRYFDPSGYEHWDEVTFELKDDKYIGRVAYPIDYNFDVEWAWDDGKVHNHWTSPKVIDYDNGIIEMSKQDFESYLGPKMKVYYVTTRGEEIDLDE